MEDTSIFFFIFELPIAIDIYIINLNLPVMYSINWSFQATCNKPWLLQVTLESKRKMQEFGVQNLGEDGWAVKKDMFFDATRTYLYAMNDQQVAIA